jgi:flagellar motility protein MotE (MotC chaperone)
MRLLEFGRDEGGASPLQTSRPNKKAESTPAKKSPAAIPETPKPPAKAARTASKARVFPIKPGNAQRKPIDLEQLQQRVAVLEKRIKARTEALGDEVAKRDLEQLKQRMKLLERSVNNELWAAKQREYQMLQLMAKPTLRMAVRQRFNTLRGKTLPALAESLRVFWGHWWHNSQPHWWNRFASAWQESLDRARGISRH